jgi:hypothetical protein
MWARHFLTQTLSPAELLFLNIVLSPLQKPLEFLVLCLAAPETEEAKPVGKKRNEIEKKKSPHTKKD